MSFESRNMPQVTEVEHTTAEAPPQRARAMLSWAAVGLLATGAGIGALHLLHTDEAPCESRTTVDGSFAAMSRSLQLPDGTTINFQVFDKSSDIDTKDPHVKVTADGSSRMIETFNTPGPEAVFTIGDTTLRVEAADSTISTSCTTATLSAK
jgi:hypothetical protein